MHLLLHHRREKAAARAAGESYTPPEPAAAPAAPAAPRELQQQADIGSQRAGIAHGSTQPPGSDGVNLSSAV